jgi:hypothetical protein
VWTFLRLAHELVAVGAPAALVARARDAADDELRHADLCRAAAGGIALADLPTHVARPRFANRSSAALAVLAAEAWCEGCLNETAAATEAALAATRAEGAVASMLAAISRDEHAHAELSWAVLGWVFSIAPAVARDALAALPPPTAPLSPSSPSSGAPHDPALARRGVPGPAITAEAHSIAHAAARARLAALVAT